MFNNLWFKSYTQQLGKRADVVEDDHSIQGHITAMKREVAKEVPNRAKITDAMQRTFAARREWIAADRPLLKTILEQYPALGTKEGVY